MLRLARLDAPGVLHHIVLRGIERGSMFKDNKDRDNALEWQRGRTLSRSTRYADG